MENNEYCGVPFCFTDGIPRDEPLVLLPSNFDGGAEVELTEVGGKGDGQAPGFSRGDTDPLCKIRGD